MKSILLIFFLVVAILTGVCIFQSAKSDVRHNAIPDTNISEMQTRANGNTMTDAQDTNFNSSQKQTGKNEPRQLFNANTRVAFQGDKQPKNKIEGDGKISMGLGNARSPKQYNLAVQPMASGNNTGMKIDDVTIGTRGEDTGASKSQWIVGQDYGPFFEKNQISGANQELIRSAIEKDTDSYRKLLSQGKLDSSVDPQIRGALLNGLKQQFETDLKGTLGADAFESLVYYRETWAARDLTSSIAEQMNAAGYPMSEEDAAGLIQILKDNSAVLSTAQLRATYPRIAQSEARRFATTEGVVMGQATTVLNPRQMEVLRQFWSSLTTNASEQNTDRQEANNNKDQTAH